MQAEKCIGGQSIRSASLRSQAQIVRKQVKCLAGVVAAG